MPDATTAASVRTFATVGLTGSTPDKAFTYAYNSTKIKHALAVEFVPNCSGVVDRAAVVGDIDFSSIARNGNSTRRARPGKNHQLSLTGAGTGQVEVEVLLNGQSCGARASVLMSAGQHFNQFVLPRSTQNFEKVGFRSQGIRKSLRVDGAGEYKNLSKRAKSKAMSKTCAEMLEAISN